MSNTRVLLIEKMTQDQFNQLSQEEKDAFITQKALNNLNNNTQ